MMIHLWRFEKFPLKLCMHELKISSFPFLSNKYFFNSQNASVLKYIDLKNNWNDAVHGVKRKLMGKWIFWYFSFLVVPLLQANFYVTESEQGEQDIYCYPKPVREKLTASTISCFKDWGYSYLDDVAVRNILSSRKFGFSKLRLQPKENGVRMVANLKGFSRMPVSTMGVRHCKTEGKVKHKENKIDFKYYQSVNNALRDAHTILKGILFKGPDKLSSSVFDYNDVYIKLCPFLVGQKKGSASMPNLFIVTSDVLKAFDSIDQDKLLDIMENFLLNDVYFLKRGMIKLFAQRSLCGFKRYLQCRMKQATMAIHNSLHLVPIVPDMVSLLTRYMHMLIKKQMHSMSLNSDIQPILELKKEQVEWLGFHAYIQVLKRKQSRHKELLAVLSSRLSSHRMSGRVSRELEYAINTKNSSLLWDIKY